MRDNNVLNLTPSKIKTCVDKHIGNQLDFAFNDIAKELNLDYIDQFDFQQIDQVKNLKAKVLLEILSHCHRVYNLRKRF